MLHAFLINPAAGQPGSAKRAAGRIETACRAAGLTYAVTVTETPGDANRITRAYADSGQEVRLYACGGDGTLNQVIQVAAGRDNIAVTNVPMGTGNDFLKLFGPEYKTAFWDIPALARGPQAAFDLMDCNGMLGLDVICAGVDARVAADVGKFKALPLVKGKGAYILSLIQNVVFKGIARPMTVQVDGQSWDQPTSILCICNGRHYGGGFMPVPDAMPDDGILDTLLVPEVSLTTFARLVGDYAGGKYADHLDLIQAHHTPGPICFEADKPITVVVDGEVMRETAFTVKLSEKKLNFFWPAGVSYRPENPPLAGDL